MNKVFSSTNQALFARPTEKRFLNESSFMGLVFLTGFVFIANMFLNI